MDERILRFYKFLLKMSILMNDEIPEPYKTIISEEVITE